MAEEKSCFVIAPIGDADSDTRKRSDQVLKHVIRPAVISCGYKAIRADEIDKPGIITSQVIQHIVSDPLVVADLTERNPNVFYELAIRHALRKPLVQLIRKGDAIPFDVAGTRTIHVDHRDLDSVEGAKNEIVDQIKALERDPSDMETPISVSLDLQLLRQSEKPEERSLADLVAAVAEVRGSLNKIETKLGTKEQQGLLDEIQAELRRLPMRLDDHLDGPRIPWIRRSKMHPMLVHEMLHLSPLESPGTGILVIASIFKDWMPWVYELGLEVYRVSRSGHGSLLSETIAEFQRAVHWATQSPMSREIFGRHKEMYVLREELEPLMQRAIAMLESDAVNRKR